MFSHYIPRVGLAVAVVLSLAACAGIPSAGPRTGEIEASRQALNSRGINLVDLSLPVVRKIAEQENRLSFADVLGDSAPVPQMLAPGDSLDVTIWEAPPAVLFGGLQTQGMAMATGGHATQLPTQVIDANGEIHIPFVENAIKAQGYDVNHVATEISRKLAGKANRPQVMVRLAQNLTSFVTVLSDGGGAVRVPFTPRSERLLDAISSAGGGKQQLDKLTVQITRGNVVRSMPFIQVINEPRQNIRLVPGDAVALLFKPNAFIAFGASGKNDEISFEEPGISLTQALARIGGLMDNRSDPSGVFVFRMENRHASTGGGDFPAEMDKIPTIYQVNLRDPGNYFLASNFKIHDKDIVYVANAPIVDLQKFLNVVFSVAYPIVNSVNALQ